MKTLRDILNLSTSYLQERHIANARREVEDLLTDVLDVNRVSLYMDLDRPLDSKELSMCRERLARRGRGEPLAYIHGQVEFFDCVLNVNSSVLIPRQETELLVDRIVRALKSYDLSQAILWDICCGSGCIGIAIKKALPELTVEMTDLSEAAVKMARSNAEKNRLDIAVHQGDFLKPFEGRKCHYLVCNPPYISEKEYQTLSREVREHEPQLALVAHHEGYAFYERLAKELPSFLYPNGQAWLEIGYAQGAKIKELFQSQYVTTVDKDYSNHDRFVHLMKAESYEPEE